MYDLFITCARGLEELLAQELESFPVSDVRLTHGGLFCKAEKKEIYTLCLQLRTASRVLLFIHEGEVHDRHSLLKQTQSIVWSQFVRGDESFVVRFSGTSETLRHTGFSSQVVKDGVLDFWRTKGLRPAVDKDEAGVTIAVQLSKGKARFFLDLSGSGLHERGYRKATGAAPIRETLAAAIAIRVLALHPETPKLVLDPCCGSGTLLVETAMILTNCAPGLLRNFWGFRSWLGHDEALFSEVLAAAEQRFSEGLAACETQFIGQDIDPKVINHADQAAYAAGVDRLFNFTIADATQADSFSQFADAENGLLLTNPPYGERLETPLAARIFYRKFGSAVRTLPDSWTAAVLAPDDTMLKAIRLRSAKKYNFYSGPLAIKLGVFPLANQEDFGARDHTDIANRLKKNWQQRHKWAKRQGVEAFRVYDADLPDYNAAVDCYGEHLVIQEYAAPQDIPDHVAEGRWWDLIDAVLSVLPFTADQLVTKQRRQQKGDAQYTRQAEQGERLESQEYNARFWVNLTDYLDTGLFLDHRLVRKDIQKLSKDKRVLNLFAYTGTASVHAALGGAEHVTTVDMSRTYLNWAKDNFRLNHLTLDKHEFIQADCLEWLQEMQEGGPQWDLIFLDPPTFSNSKRMEASFDIQRDYLQLLEWVKPLLAPNGLLIFSTNKRRFKFSTDEASNLGYSAVDRTQQSIPEDFKRQRLIHHCWYLSHA
ncbi:MAG: bifunctional 23S rRNA (guanine(2069)-N(7))-methyltransferase RlmK/23S rRNA (guanine(2445)-N(2))-methyltransferase RlmL [Idiomarina sp.]|nr:bifunctional 23S rRNA (guanine(2069)-N(7))-methyltransferase RlmK/23S rRNA (guanine(2445)-N(2))-methyltransferase RlmL [Idiomarina sp.]